MDTQHRHPKKGTWFRIAGWVSRNIFYRPMGGLCVRGTENVPISGPLIVAAVHLSHLDPPLIGSTCPRQVRFMAKEELFRNPFLSALIKSLGAFPIKRGTSDMSAIKLTLKWLEDGNTVLVFPEGQRGDGVSLGALQPGTAMLAKKSGATIIPVGLSGPERVLSRGKGGLHRARVTVVFGKPFTYAEIAGSDEDKTVRQHFTEELAKRIADTCHEAGLDLRIDGPN